MLLLHEEDTYNSYIRRIEESILNKDLGRGVGSTLKLERHHIIPRCCGGEDTISNLIECFPGEHFILHHLAATESQVEGSRFCAYAQKLIYAVNMMCGKYIFRERGYPVDELNQLAVLHEDSKQKFYKEHPDDNCKRLFLVERNTWKLIDEYKSVKSAREFVSLNGYDEGGPIEHEFRFEKLRENKDYEYLLLTEEEYTNPKKRPVEIAVYNKNNSTFLRCTFERGVIQAAACMKVSEEELYQAVLFNQNEHKNKKVKYNDTYLYIRYVVS